MRNKLMLGAVLAVAAAALVVLPLTASAGDQGKLTIGVRLDFSSATEATGSFAVCCAVDDGGAAKALITSYTEQGDKAAFTATNTFAGENGSFTIRLRGITGPLSSERHVAHGRWHVIDGDGAYEDLKARGRLTALTDESTGALTAIDTGRTVR